MKCKKCGEEITNNCKYCEYCGKKVGKRSKKQRYVVLCIAGIILVCLFLVTGLNTSDRNEVSVDTIYTIEPVELREDVEESFASQQDIEYEITQTYQVNTSMARIYDYCISSDGDTYMSDLHLYYVEGVIVNGEIVELANHGNYLMVSWEDNGQSRRGFIKSTDVVKIE